MGHFLFPHYLGHFYFRDEMGHFVCFPFKFSTQKMEEYDRDAPLFDRRFHVLVQYPDRDEKLLPLTVRLLTGVRVGPCVSCFLRFFTVTKD